MSWRFTGPRGNELAKGQAAVSEAGGFDLAFDLPDDVNLGTGYVYIQAEGGGYGSSAHNQPVQIHRWAPDAAHCA